MLTVVIQSGGESRRMGRDKGLVPFLGKPLIERVIGRVSHLADEVIVTTNNPDGYQFLGVRLEADVRPGRGALGGLYTALSTASHPLVAVIACDMPFASPALLSAERDIVQTQNMDACVPRGEHGWEPFHAVYYREKCLPAIEAALDADKWRVDAWFWAVRLYSLPADEVLAIDPSGRAFWNANTPEDIAWAEQIVKEQEEIK